MKVSTDYKHDLPNDVQEEWKKGLYVGGWRPTIAYPYFIGFGRVRCGCGRKFRNIEDFEAHYLYKAIWKLESDVLPSEWKRLETPQ